MCSGFDKVQTASIEGMADFVPGETIGKLIRKSTPRHKKTLRPCFCFDFVFGQINFKRGHNHAACRRQPVEFPGPCEHGRVYAAVKAGARRAAV